MKWENFEMKMYGRVRRFEFDAVIGVGGISR